MTVLEIKDFIKKLKKAIPLDLEIAFGVDTEGLFLSITYISERGTIKSVDLFYLDEQEFLSYDFLDIVDQIEEFFDEDLNNNFDDTEFLI